MGIAVAWAPPREVAVAATEALEAEALREEAREDKELTEAARLLLEEPVTVAADRESEAALLETDEAADPSEDETEIKEEEDDRLMVEVEELVVVNDPTRELTEFEA